MAGRKRRKLNIFIITNLSIFFCLLVGFALFFRSIRDALPPTPIGEDNIVGYAQYFGYPLFLDVVIFFLFISVPVVVGLIIKLRGK